MVDAWAWEEKNEELLLNGYGVSGGEGETSWSGMAVAAVQQCECT